MLYITVCLNVLPGVDFDEAYKAAKEVEAHTKNDAGCLYFHVYPLSREKRQLMMWEIWTDKAAVAASHEMPHTKAFFAKKLVAPEFGYESIVE
ncbi:antibiotic biosynthesis monooxygenase [Christensenellaceae bacterium OttesenSCG-928-L17]|nr:antibiotic biosynthesis monooxygenase [Christensenellaceae bacterium OttesenSCG-928-L17]